MNDFESDNSIGNVCSSIVEIVHKLGHLLYDFQLRIGDNHN